MEIAEIRVEGNEPWLLLLFFKGDYVFFANVSKEDDTLIHIITGLYIKDAVYADDYLQIANYLNSKYYFAKVPVYPKNNHRKMIALCMQTEI